VKGYDALKFQLLHRVNKSLGNGFLEPVYQEALAFEFELQEIPYVKEKQLKIKYKDTYLQKYYMADFICYDTIIVECKALKGLLPEHEAQVLNYLYATEIKLGLLINFGARQVEVKRMANLDGKIKTLPKKLPTKRTEMTEN